MAFNCVSYFEQNVGISLAPILKTVYQYAFYLLMLKMVWKLFSVYLLGTDGDEDTAPTVIIINYVKAIVVSLSFGLLFDYIMSIASEITGAVMSHIKYDTEAITPTLVFGKIVEITTGYGMLELILCGLWGILAFALCIVILKISVELVVLRTGAVFSTVGLLDSDGGVFKPYIKKIFQECFSVLLIVFFYKLSLYAMYNLSFIWGITLMIFAFTSPQFLSEFIMMHNSQGGSKVQQGLYSMSIIRSFAKA